MFWADKIANSQQGNQVVNDSKTPSGRVHVGSLRGVIVHDVIYRALKRAEKPVKFFMEWMIMMPLIQYHII